MSYFLRIFKVFNARFRKKEPERHISTFRASGSTRALVMPDFTWPLTFPVYVEKNCAVVCVLTVDC